MARKLLGEYNLEIGGGLGKLAGQVWRIGLMGYNSRPENVLLLLEALKQVLDEFWPILARLQVVMDKEIVLERLRLTQQELQQKGILHAAVFGSVARGDAREDSNLDIPIEIAVCPPYFDLSNWFALFAI